MFAARSSLTGNKEAGIGSTNMPMPSELVFSATIEVVICTGIFVAEHGVEPVI